MNEVCLDPTQDGAAGQIARLEAELARCRAELLDVRAAAARAFGLSAEERTARLAQVNTVLRREVERTAGERDFDGLLNYLLLEATSAAGAACGALFLHIDGTAFEPAAVVDGGSIVAPEHWQRNPLFDGFAEHSGRDEDGRFAAILARDVGDREPVDAATLWPEALAFHQAYGQRMVWNEPLVLGGKVVGYLGLARTDERPPGPKVVEAVRAVVGQMAVAVQLARLADEAHGAAVARERERAAQERATELARANAALRQAIESLRDVDDLDAFLARVVAAAEQVSGADEASVLLVDADRREMQVKHFVRGGAVLDIDTDPMPTPWREPLTEGRDYEQRAADKPFDSPGRWWMAVDDPLMPQAARTWHEARGHRSVANVPMYRDGRPLGFLGLAFHEAVRPSPAKLEMAQVLAQQVTLALELTRLGGKAREAAVAREREQAAHERVAELARANEALTRTTAGLAAEQDLDSFLGALLIEAIRQIDACSCTLFLYDAAEHTLSMRLYALGERLLDVATDPRLEIWREAVPADLNSTWNDLLRRKPVLQVLDRPDPDVWQHSIGWHREMGHVAILSLALFVGDRPIGFVGLCLPDRRIAAPERIELAQALVNHAALALELVRLTASERESQARLLLAHDAARIGAWDWDLATGDVVWSPHNFRLWGVAPPAEGPSVLPAETVLTAIHPEDQPRVRAELDAAVSQGKPFRSEFRVGGPGSGERWLAGLGRHVAPGAGPGRAGRMIGVNLDVTERRAAERTRVDRGRLAELARANAALRATLDALPAVDGGAEGALDPFLGQVLVAVSGLLQAPEAALWLHDAEAGATRVQLVYRDGAILDAAASGLAEAGRAVAASAMDPGWTMLGQAAPTQQARPQMVDDLATDPRLTDAHRARLLAQGTRALVLLPLVLRGEQTVGTISLRLPAPRRFAPEDLELAQALAQQVTLAIHLDQLAQHARDEARQSAVLDERNRAAQEIHDTLAQCFTSILLQLQAAARFTVGKPDLARACLARAEALARDGLAEARRSVTALLPGAEEHRDLPGALRRLARQATTGTSAPATVRAAGTPRPLAPDVARNLFRIVQEALGNAQRYAQGASGIQVRLHYRADGVELTVRDDGCGFDQSSASHSRGHGLAGMRARAARIGASFSLDSRPGGGASVRVWLPRESEGA